MNLFKTFLFIIYFIRDVFVYICLKHLHLYLKKGQIEKISSHLNICILLSLFTITYIIVTYSIELDK